MHTLPLNMTKGQILCHPMGLKAFFMSYHGELKYLRNRMFSGAHFSQLKIILVTIFSFIFFGGGVKMLGLGHKSQLTPIDLCPP